MTKGRAFPSGSALAESIITHTQTRPITRWRHCTGREEFEIGYGLRGKRETWKYLLIVV
jgi:hypothetical protein